MCRLWRPPLYEIRQAQRAQPQATTYVVAHGSSGGGALFPAAANNAFGIQSWFEQVGFVRAVLFAPKGLLRRSRLFSTGVGSCLSVAATSIPAIVDDPLW